MEQLLASINTPESILLLCNTLLEHKLLHLVNEIASFSSSQSPSLAKLQKITESQLSSLSPAQSFESLNSLYSMDFDIKDYTDILSHQNKLVPHLKDLYTDYPSDIVQSISNSKGKETANITFTMTTCKRLDLFVPTMNSFLRCCTDRHLISRWIIVDDNSS